MSDHHNGPQDPNAPEERKEPAAPQTPPPPAEDGAQPFYLRPPFIAGAVIAIIAIVAIAFLVGPSGDQGAEPEALAEAPANDVAEATGWELGRPGDIVLGSPNAPVKLVEYASVTCGHCAAFKLAVFPDIKKKYIDTGLVQYTLREFPTPPMALAVRGFMLARCTGEDRYYQALEALFRTQPLWVKPNPQEARDNLEKISRQFGLNTAEFQACIEDEQELKRINEVVQAGRELYGINSTPSFVINGERAEIQGATFEALDTAIQQQLPEGTEVPDYTPAGYNRTESGQPEPDDGAAEEEEEDASEEGAGDEGASDEGDSEEGESDEGTSDEGTSDEGTSDEGESDEGTSDEGASDEGTSDDGTADEGASDEDTSEEDAGDDGASDDGDSDDSDSGDGGEEGTPETEK